jgi:antitoxin YefM
LHIIAKRLIVKVESHAAIGCDKIVAMFREKMNMETSTLDISEARKQFSQLDKRLREDRVIWITRHNKKAFAVVDSDLLQTVLETIEILSDPDALKMLQDSLSDIRAGRLRNHEDVKSELLRGSESNR